ncbi:MAG: hypothetical protein ACR2G2_13600 [Pseudonocardia sp.]
MTNRRNPAIAIAIAITVLLVLAGALYLVSGRETDTDDTRGGTLSAADREALGAQPVERGVDPGGPDPSVDLTGPAAVAAAYVVAGYSLLDTDAAHTNRRAVPYAAPATPPSTVGVLVVAPPSVGHRITATVTQVERVSGEETDTRRGYLVGYRTTLDPPDRLDRALHNRYLLLVRQFDGRWLVAGDTADGQVGEP